ncbi:MAG: hypothetical protein AVDCRST_MAG02-1119, partial [uncultured Rubrobacteraceae bacterium]
VPSELGSAWWGSRRVRRRGVRGDKRDLPPPFRVAGLELGRPRHYRLRAGPLRGARGGSLLRGARRPLRPARPTLGPRALRPVARRRVRGSFGLLRRLLHSVRRLQGVPLAGSDRPAAEPYLSRGNVRQGRGRLSRGRPAASGRGRRPGASPESVEHPTRRPVRHDAALVLAADVVRPSGVGVGGVPGAGGAARVGLDPARRGSVDAGGGPRGGKRLGRTPGARRQRRACI